MRPKALQLKYKFDKSLRGGKGGFAEVLVPAKKTAAADKQVWLGRAPGCVADNVLQGTELRGRAYASGRMPLQAGRDHVGCSS